MTSINMVLLFMRLHQLVFANFQKLPNFSILNRDYIAISLVSVTITYKIQYLNHIHSMWWEIHFDVSSITHTRQAVTNIINAGSEALLKETSERILKMAGKNNFIWIFFPSHSFWNLQILPSLCVKSKNDIFDLLNVTLIKGFIVWTTNHEICKSLQRGAIWCGNM